MYWPTLVRVQCTEEDDGVQADHTEGKEVEEENGQGIGPPEGGWGLSDDVGTDFVFQQFLYVFT